MIRTIMVIFFFLNLTVFTQATVKEDIINKLKNTNNLEGSAEKDELYQAALEIIKLEGKASTSFLQRKLQLGYNRAARIIDMMEEEGIVSKANHVGKRDVL